MSLWKRLFGRGSDDESGARDDADGDQKDAQARAKDALTATRKAREQQAADEARDKANEVRQQRIARLERVGRDGGATVKEALALLRDHDGSAEQTRYLHAAMNGLDDDPRLDPLRVACATILEARGERGRALALVAPSRSVAGMMLAAELHASDGDLARAVSLVERVLARDIDAPGARGRHERWSEQLGRRQRSHAVDDNVTVVAPALEKKGAFRLIREVARGGAGTVYEAEDEVLGRRLAYKVYHQASRDRDQIEREGRRAVQLSGPGVLRVFDMDPSEGWLAYEWIARGSLRDILVSGRVADVLPLASWLPKLLHALGRVHDAGLVHSDVKPANVLFRSQHEPVLGDFGSCSPLGEGGLTGTPGYMSPERLAGSAADPRDDVYAIGRVVEDVLAAREDGKLPPELVQASEDDARQHARVALACLADAASRPSHARDVLALTQTGDSAQGGAS